MSTRLHQSDWFPSGDLGPLAFIPLQTCQGVHFKNKDWKPDITILFHCFPCVTLVNTEKKIEPEGLDTEIRIKH